MICPAYESIEILDDNSPNSIDGAAWSVIYVRVGNRVWASNSRPVTEQTENNLEVDNDIWTLILGDVPEDAEYCGDYDIKNHAPILYNTILNSQGGGLLVLMSENEIKIEELEKRIAALEKKINHHDQIWDWRR